MEELPEVPPYEPGPEPRLATERILRRVAEAELQRDRRPSWPGRFIRRVIPRRLLRLKPPTAAEKKLLASRKLDIRQQRRSEEAEVMYRKIGEEYAAEPRRARRKIARALLRDGRERVRQAV